MNLYWVTTEDHAEDWFIVAIDPEEAATFHEEMEGYDPGDATAEMILKLPKGIVNDIGWPSDDVLQSCGANILVDGPTRIVEIGDRKFCEGLMESTIRALDDDMFEALGQGRPNKTRKPTKH